MASGPTTTVAAKGQVILPKAIREQLRWGPGTRLAVEHTADGVILRRVSAAFPPTLAADVFGCLSNAGPPKSLREMEAGIAAEVKRRHARGRALRSSTLD